MTHNAFLARVLHVLLSFPSTGEGNGKPLQYACLENPMNSMKRQKDRTLKDELPKKAHFIITLPLAMGKSCNIKNSKNNQRAHSSKQIEDRC